MQNKEAELKKITKKYYEDLDHKKSIKLNSVEERVFENFKEGEKVLDVCCGFGRTSVILAEKNLSVVGVDLVLKLIQSGRKNIPAKNKVDFIVGDASQLPFKDRIFDHVICLGRSLDILPSPSQREKTVLEIARVLKKEGSLFIQTANMRNFGKYGLDWAKHVFLFISRLPKRIWRRLRGKSCVGLYLGDCFYKPGTSSKNFAHVFLRRELKTYLDKTKLEYKIYTDHEFLGDKRFKAMFSPELVTLAYKS